MSKTLAKELKEQGISISNFIKIYNVVRSVRGELYLPLLEIPAVYKNDTERVFEYLKEHGALETTEKEKDVYRVRAEGIDTMNARIKSLEMLKEKIKEKAGEAKRKVSGE